MTVDRLIALDIEFCDSVSKLGASGWARHFKDDGIMLTKSGDNIISESSIYEAMKPFFSQSGNQLTWAPEGGGISMAGDLGYTFGKYIRITKTEQGKQTDTGRYLTIWRKVSENTYKIELDMGN